AGVLLQFAEPAERAPRVQEADPGAAVGSGSRLLIDRLDPVRLRTAEGIADVVHRVRDMVDALATLRDEPADRRIILQRLHELDLSVADPERRRLHPVCLGYPAMGDLQAEDLLVKLDRLVKVL